MATNRKFVREEDRAMNVWLSTVDQLLDRRIPLLSAMYYAGEKLQEDQQQSGQQKYHPTDLWVATQEINLLLRRCPQYQQRKAGWAKGGQERETY